MSLMTLDGRLAVAAVIALSLGIAACGGTAESDGPSPTPTPTVEPTPTPSPTPTPMPEYQDPFSLKVGTCFDPIEDIDDEGLLAARLTSCDEPHLMEVFGLPSVGAATAPFPGLTAVDDAAREACDSAFKRYVGISILRSVLDYYYYTPTEDSWAMGDRQVLCVVAADRDEWLTESVKGSKR